MVTSMQDCSLHTIMHHAVIHFGLLLSLFPYFDSCMCHLALCFSFCHFILSTLKKRQFLTVSNTALPSLAAVSVFPDRLLPLQYLPGGGSSLQRHRQLSGGDRRGAIWGASLLLLHLQAAQRQTGLPQEDPG